MGNYGIMHPLNAKGFYLTEEVWNQLKQFPAETSRVLRLFIEDYGYYGRELPTSKLTDKEKMFVLYAYEVIDDLNK